MGISFVKAFSAPRRILRYVRTLQQRGFSNANFSRQNRQKSAGARSGEYENAPVFSRCFFFLNL
jgi:hypothetical protein